MTSVICAYTYLHVEQSRLLLFSHFLSIVFEINNAAHMLFSQRKMYSAERHVDT